MLVERRVAETLLTGSALCGEHTAPQRADLFLYQRYFSIHQQQGIPSAGAVRAPAYRLLTWLDNSWVAPMIKFETSLG